MRKQFLFILFSLSFYSAFAQKTNLKATVKDSLTGEPLSFAAATLLNAVDSQLVQVNYSDENGSIELSTSKSGVYYFCVSYLSYEAQIKSIKITSENVGKTIDFGTLKMSKKSTLLSDVTIKADIVAIALKGDTVEYNPQAFKTRPNANVEELLKKIPGVEVDKDGSIKANGEGVTKILVDGKPFFGSDPTMATKNLSADAIEKVQVYDQKSEQSQFTGINDGSQGKTIDLKLKANKKKGQFGKANVGYGTDKRFMGTANLFNYRSNYQIALLSGANNINASPFSSQDGSGNTGRGGGDDGNGSSVPRNGMNTIYSFGSNFNTELKRKTKLAASYYVHHTIQAQKINTSRQYFQSQIVQNEDNTLNSDKKLHTITFQIEHKFDKNNSLKITPNLLFEDKEIRSLQHLTSSKNSSILSEQTRNSRAFGQVFTLKGNAIFNHKFEKEGRTFSLSSNYSFSKSKSDELNEIQLQDSSKNKQLNQKWYNKNDMSSFPFSMSYTEPFSKEWKFEMSYLYGKWSNTTIRDAYVSEDSSDVSLFNPATSAHLKTLNQQHRATARLQYEKLRYTITMENAHEFYPRESVSELNQITVNQYFIYFLPSARLQYNLPKKMRWGVNYTTNVNYPSINQLISTPDNSNPLRVQIGNPKLLPIYTHSFQANFNKFDSEKNKFFHAFARFSLPQNAVSTASVFESQGRQISQNINVNGNYNYSTSLGVGMPLKKVKINLDGSFRGNKRIAFINQIRSESFTNNVGSSLKINYDANEKIDLSLNSGLSYNFAKSNLNLAQKNQYYNWDSGAEATVQLALGFELSSDVTFNRYYGLSQGYNRYFTLWNASLAKSFFKDKSLEIKILAFDILKQNQNIGRDVTVQYIVDERGINLTRYFLLQATYYLNKTVYMDRNMQNSGRKNNARKGN